MAMNWSSSNDSGNNATALVVTEEGNSSLENDDPAEEAEDPRSTTHRWLPGRSLTDDATSPNTKNTTLEHALSFGCGLGSSMGYIATLSSLVYFKMLYGPNSFVYLNIAVYFPLLPISLAQARWDQYYDVQFTSRTTFWVRGMVGFLLNLCGTYGIQIWHDKSSIGTVIFLALLQGTGGAIIFGTLNQMASFVSGGSGTGDDRSFQTAVSTGVQASALVVWVVSLWTGFGVHEADCFASFMGTIGWMQVVCLGFFLWLLRARPPVAAAMMRRDSSLRLLVQSEGDRIHNDSDDYLFQDPETENIFESRLDEPLLSSLEASESISASEMSFGELWYQTKDCGWILIGTLIPSFLVASWFTHVDTDWMGLASVLFYIRIGSDLVGRLATIWIPPSHVSSLKRLTALRLVLVVAFFVNARQSLRVLVVGVQGRASDGLSMILVAMIAFFSGYLVTGAFQLAPTCLETENQSKHVAKQASLLTVAFSVSAVGGLLLSFCFLALGV